LGHAFPPKISIFTRLKVKWSVVTMGLELTFLARSAGLA
jgi:hypothetical protein